jgi:hypothetical protein
MALVDSWQYWAKQNGYWLEKSDALVRGDIIVFKWNPSDTKLDHIGMVASFAGGDLMTYEGNRGNQTVYGSRSMSFVAGVVQIPV